MNNVTLDAIADNLLGRRDFVLTSHISPDPDAIGSSCALALALKQLGKGVRLYYADPVPERMKALVPQIEIGHTAPSDAFETLVVCDTAAKKRVGSEIDKLFSLAEFTFNIDHHISNDGWAQLNYVDPTAPATALIIWELLPLLRVQAGPEIANLLLSGLMDDTGTFCFSNTTARSFECAAGLTRAGARPAFVANELYFTLPMPVLKLRASALESLRLYLNGKLSYVTITRKDMENAGAKPEDAEGIVEVARQVAGADIAVLQRELDDGWKFSLRSKREEIDVNKTAMRFGGGGHKAAAGCKLTGTEEEVRKLMVDAVTEDSRHAR